MKRRTLLAAALAAAAPAPGQAAGQDIAVAKEAQPFRRTAEAFVESAIAADTAATLKMLSPTLVARMGPDQARAVLQRQIQPFFAEGRGIGPNSTVTRTTDANGHNGFAFYLWLLPKPGTAQAPAGPPRPFVLHVVTERGQRVVSNVLPNQRVDGRHPNP
jgi:hypothetical protein